MGGDRGRSRDRGCLGRLRPFSSVHVTEGAAAPFSPAETCDCDPFTTKRNGLLLFACLYGAVAVLGARGELRAHSGGGGKRRNRARASAVGAEAAGVAPPGGSAGSGTKICVGHAAFGREQLELGVATAPAKRAYAARHGYAFLSVGAPDYESLLGEYCPKIAAEARTADPATGAKYCAVHHALGAARCDWMLLTDVRATVLDPAVTVADLVGAADDAPGEEAPAVVWFVNVARGACETPSAFADAVQTGALLVRAAPFGANVLTHNVLALSSMPAAFLANSDCASGGSEPNACEDGSDAELCSVGCLHKLHPNWLENARCRYAVADSKFPALATFDVVDHERSDRAGRGTLLGDCAGAAPYAQVLDCVTKARAWARREIPAEDGGPPL